jgi:hypothetical protein
MIAAIVTWQNQNNVPQQNRNNVPPLPGMLPSSQMSQVVRMTVTAPVALPVARQVSLESGVPKYVKVHLYNYSTLEELNLRVDERAQCQLSKTDGGGGFAK